VIVLEWLTALLLLLGAILSLLAAIGVLRFPDTFSRMQASSKASTLGLACLLAGTALQFSDVSVLVRLGSIAAFIMLTAPLSAHVVARAALHRGTPLWEGTVLNEYDSSACEPERDAEPEPERR
jgi:multicomponent Na+:H+ antiporter subunit G